MIESLFDILTSNSYPGRGILVGTGADAQSEVIAYFIMGRSANSRNRVFEEFGDGNLRTRAFDESKVQDPSLIIYTAVRSYGNMTVVTNGDQTDTVIGALERGGSFREALSTRCYEPDAPNYTPRISAISHAGGYSISILKAQRPIVQVPPLCARYCFDYERAPGQGHLIHTYAGDGDPLPSFEGEPRPVSIASTDAHSLAQNMWDALDSRNRIALFVRYTCANARDTAIINAHNGGTA
ncbi:MAG: IMP cyclohydrolase [Clostridia bacterium]|nr:IMP cyclohydrolase [Clostridia bacterium]